MDVIERLKNLQMKIMLTIVVVSMMVIAFIVTIVSEDTNKQIICGSVTSIFGLTTIRVFKHFFPTTKNDEIES